MFGKYHNASLALFLFLHLRRDFQAQRLLDLADRLFARTG
jgi:hypothetical protein